MSWINLFSGNLAKLASGPAVLPRTSCQLGKANRLTSRALQVSVISGWEWTLTALLTAKASLLLHQLQMEEPHAFWKSMLPTWHTSIEVLNTWTLWTMISRFKNLSANRLKQVCIRRMFTAALLPQTQLESTHSPSFCFNKSRYTHNESQWNYSDENSKIKNRTNILIWFVQKGQKKSQMCLNRQKNILRRIYFSKCWQRWTFGDLQVGGETWTS